jgi:hypothetical protein
MQTPTCAHGVGHATLLKLGYNAVTAHNQWQQPRDVSKHHLLLLHSCCTCSGSRPRLLLLCASQAA